MRTKIALTGLAVFTVVAATDGWGSDSMVSASKAVVSRYKTVFSAPPRRTPNNKSVDGPLLGNGDMLACLGGGPEALRFFLTNDFWQLRHGNGRPSYFGTLALNCDQLKGAKYLVEQPLYTAETHGKFTHPAGTVHMRTVLCATENVMVITLSAEGAGVSMTVGLSPAAGADGKTDSGAGGNSAWGIRKFDEGMEIPTACAAAVTIRGARALTFDLAPARPVTIAVAMRSAFEDRDCVGAAKRLAVRADPEALIDAHHKWWADYWARSYVDIGDPIIELQYYKSNYTMGACSRDREFPPCIFGWIASDNPAWKGDYHMNYNHMAPFYGLPSSNHLEQSATYHAPLLAMIERCQWYAKEVYGAEGVLYPVGIGPKGIETTRDHPKYAKNSNSAKGGLFFGQKTNASYGVVPMAFHWRHSYDLDYAREVYPFVLEAVAFWESDLKFENGRYVDYDDAVHEGSNRGGSNFNPVLALGLIRNTFETALDMSRALGVDSDRHEKWRHILKHLSTYTTQDMSGTEVFRYTESGTSWWRNNTLGIQHIYPGNAIGLDSDPKSLEISRNTIRVMQRWLDGNGSNSFFPAAVRVGWDPDDILKNLRRYSQHTYPNGFQNGNPHGVENCSTVPSTINEMLCMGHGPGDEHGRRNVMRLFAVWPRDRAARFAGLRTWGAFIVSSAIEGGDVKYVKIESDSGQPCTVVNPWPGKRVVVYREGRSIAELDGERFTFGTAEGATYILGPKGVELPALEESMNATLPTPAASMSSETGKLEVVVPDGAEARYTTDGREPTARSTLYRGPVALPTRSRDITVRVRVFGADGSVSPVGTLVVKGPESGGALINCIDSVDDVKRLNITDSGETPVWYASPGRQRFRPAGGKSGFFRLHPKSQTVPATISRRVLVPARGRSRLRIVTAADPTEGVSDFLLRVRVTGRAGKSCEFGPETVAAGPKPSRDDWKTFEHDITEFAGGAATIVVEVHGGGRHPWHNERAYFDEISVIAE